ncbi:MAG: hypothetical protein J07HX64_01478 [halophilic archaeon J07HX64]|nr:MAG: hypothetical protein J07HX64_01478 [halophilic archaeon J07HX64]
MVGDRLRPTRVADIDHHHRPGRLLVAVLDGHELAGLRDVAPVDAPHRVAPAVLPGRVELGPLAAPAAGQLLRTAQHGVGQWVTTRCPTGQTLPAVDGHPLGVDPGGR